MSTICASKFTNAGRNERNGRAGTRSVVEAGHRGTTKNESDGAQAPAPQPTDRIFPFRVDEQTLDNGLRIVSIPYQSPGIVSFYLVVRTGSRDEVDSGHSGFAHFFEHMMFRGTERYPAAKYNETLKRMGADANAFTNDDKTVYHITGPVTGLETMIEIEAARFKNLKYGEAAFRTEALAVLGEYNKSASIPFLALREKLREVAFTEHTYRHTTIGFLADIKAMPGYYDYSLGFFDRFYRPENTVAIVIGDISSERIFTSMAHHFADWKPGYRPPQVPPERPQLERRTAHVSWSNPIRPYFMIGYRTPAFSTKSVDVAALYVIAQLLFSEAAPLYQELVVRRQWVDVISGGTEDHRDPYLFTIGGLAKDEDLAAKAIGLIDEHLARLARESVDAARLDRIKSHLRYSFALSLDSPDAIAERVAHYIGLTGSVETINDLFQQYSAVTPADIQRIAQATFRKTGETVVILSSAREAIDHPGDKR